MEAFGAISIFLLVMAAVGLAVALIVAWIVMPFAVIGTKPLLQALLRETKMTNELLRMRQQAAAQLPRARVEAPKTERVIVG